MRTGEVLFPRRLSVGEAVGLQRLQIDTVYDVIEALEDKAIVDSSSAEEDEEEDAQAEAGSDNASRSCR